VTADVAIVGMAFRFPGASDPETFWSHLRGGVESISFFSPQQLIVAGTPPALAERADLVRAAGVLDGVDRFDAAFFDFTPREAEIMDPQHRLLLECAWEALEGAGYDPDRPAGPIGLFAGANSATYLFNVLAAGARRESFGRMEVEIGNEKDHLASQVSYRLNLHGPSVTVQTGCSTSLVAVHLAIQSLLGYECDLALAGGVSIALPQIQGYVYQEGGVLSPDGHCRAFDARARGTVPGSGAALVALKRLEDALAAGDAVHALIKGSAVNNDGARKVGYTAPSIAGQAQVIAQALAMARSEARDVSYVEAHGTGTALGDPIEMAALCKAFAASAGAAGSCGVGSVKTNLGHLNTAAGIAGLIKTVLMLRHRLLAPSLHFERLNPEIDLSGSPFYVNAELRPWETGNGPRRAGISSFSIGGTNAHVILEEAPPAPVRSGPAAEGPQLLVLSAKTSRALGAAAARLAAELGRTAGLDLGDVAFTLQAGRKAFGHRRTLVVGGSTGEAAAALTAGSAGAAVSAGTAGAMGDSSAFHDGGYRPVAFLFPGQGAQVSGVGARLYRCQPVFRREVDRCLEILAPRLGNDVRRLLLLAASDAQDAAHVVAETELAQPALFVCEHALASLWMEWGVRPEAGLGHSLGEIAAAHLAGVFSLEDALALVVERGRLMQELPPGGMLAVALAEADLALRLAGSALDLAAVNGPAACVVSGAPEAVAALEEQLAAEGVAVRRLPVSRAFHSRAVEPAVAPFVRRVAEVRRQPPSLPWISNVTGGWIGGHEAMDPAYWGRQLRQTVRFAEGLSSLLAEPARVLLEVGPGDALTRLAGRHPRHGAGRVAAASLASREHRDEERSILDALGRLWAAGVEVDWPAFHAGKARRRVALPTYPFERRRFWIEGAGEDAAAAPATADQGPLWLPVWSQTIGPGPAAAVPGRNWLVLCRGAGLGERIVERLRRRGEQVARVEPGAAFSRRGDDFVLRPARRDDCSALLAALTAEQRAPTLILHLWCLGGDGAAASERPPGGWLELGLHSLIALAQAIGDQGGRPPRLVVVSSGVQAIAGEPALQPEKAALLGPCRVIPREYPGLTCQSIDVVPPAPGSPQEDRLAEHLIAEAAGGPGDVTIAYREGTRWVRRCEPLPLPAAPAAPGVPDPLREAGVYLVLGGLDGMGFEVAGYLARQVHARLILAGRGAAPGPERIAGLTAAGAEVLVAAGFDVSAAAAAGELVQRSRRRFGAIHGAILAEEPGGGSGLIQFRERAATDAALAPSLRGLPRLAELLGDGLDLLVLFSSTFAETGGLGLVDRCAGDAFLDAYAWREHRRRPGRVQSLGWSLWRGAPAGESVALQAHLDRERAEGGFNYAEGLELLARALASKVPQLLVSRRDLSRTAMAAPEASVWELAAADRDDGGHARPDLATTYAAPTNDIEREIADGLQLLLGLEQVGVDDNFFALGAHSLLAIQLIHRLRARFQIDLPLSAVFEAPTVSALAVRIAEARLDSVADSREIEAMVHEIQALSPDEVRDAIARESVADDAAETGGDAAADAAEADAVAEAGDHAAANADAALGAPAARAMSFSLMFFSSDGGKDGPHKYRLLLECARFADRHGFEAIWTPERHFQDFGGLYPNPSVLSAALAMVTERLEIRAGSLVLPLHHPIRVAEDWLLLDNLSGGRVGLSLASGWHPSDFALAPDAYDERRRLTFAGIETIRRIWSEGRITAAHPAGGEVEIVVLPRPLRPELPLWVTTSGTLATWEKAGEIGANVLSGLHGDPEGQLAMRIDRYRRSRQEHGHDAAAGRVTVMLHTFLGQDLEQVRETLRQPMVSYLKTFIAEGKESLDAASLGVEPSALSDRDQEDVAAFAFNRFFAERSLLGTPASCAPLLQRLQRIGVDEVACLLDFGLDAETVLSGLPFLDRLRREHAAAAAMAAVAAAPGGSA
jgi:phthiocerol/phenolphthiocerol synthesis type-I polyketide synthase E